MPPPAELVPFLALAKGARGRAAADVVMRAIEVPDVHVFGELLVSPVGLFPAARSPSTLALSVLAQVVAGHEALRR